MFPRWCQLEGMVSDPNLTFILDPECKWEYSNSDEEEDGGGDAPGPSNFQLIGGTSYRRQPRKGVCGPPTTGALLLIMVVFVGGVGYNRRQHGFTFQSFQRQQLLSLDTCWSSSSLGLVMREDWYFGWFQDGVLAASNIHYTCCNASVWHLFTILWRLYFKCLTSVFDAIM